MQQISYLFIKSTTFQHDPEIQVQKLSINIIEKYRDYKWGFIAQYWKKNYQNFDNVGH
jgi:hypothetical protein